MKTALVFFLVASTFGYLPAAPPATSAEQLLDPYFIMQKSLASDTISGVAAAKEQLAKISHQAAGVEPQARTQLIAIADAATKLQTSNLKSARDSFGELSDRLIAYLQATGSKRNPPISFSAAWLRRAGCSPAKRFAILIMAAPCLHVASWFNQNNPSINPPNTIIIDPRTTIPSVTGESWLKEPNSNPS